MSLAEYVQILGRGPGRSRTLTQAEATQAMQIMLSGRAAPEAIGALLMLLRMKGETAQEIAGFATAAQAAMTDMPSVDLDWPSYAAGRTRGAPWFLLSAKLVAQAGHRVLMHGWNGSDVKVRAGLHAAGIPVAQSVDEAATLLDQTGIAYLPLETAHPALFALLNLREVLGLRSCINTVCRMLNPGRAKTSVQGVFHPSYRLLQADAAALMGWDSLSVIKGGGGEFERHPAKDITAFGVRNGQTWEGIFPAIRPEARRLAEQTEMPDVSLRHPTDFDTDIITGTTALALDSLGARNPMEKAHRLWAARHGAMAA